MAISITEDIRDLLYEHQLVIIHGLGMIRAGYQGAQINEQNQTISPPRLEYSFDNRIKESDGLFEKFIEKKYRLSEEQAQQVVKRFRDQVYNLLENDKKIVIQGIGKLARENNRIVLNSYEGTEDPVSFGLPDLSLKKSSSVAPLNLPGDVVSPVKSGPDIPTYKNVSAKNKSASGAASSGNSPNESASQDPQNDPKEPKFESSSSSLVDPGGQNQPTEEPGSRKKSVFPWILVLLLVLSFLIVLFSGLYLLNDNVSGFVHKLLNNEEKENIMDSEASRASDSSIKSLDDESSERQDEDVAEKEIPVKEALQKDCVVIVGLFGDEENVKRIKGLIQSKGYEVYQRSLGSGDQMGIYTSCNDYNSALTFAKQELAPDAFLKKLKQ